ncbi:MAG TPA: YpmS family protein [Candidatus Salinicoccus stercoripullorum]|uniref:YpmS family protein n=1 Tax=Candidatus Salinicoccus stercoripullorum TaxID=2838756 RepID=A0A9D1TZG1_9STAP|nr:YpmS family protein [Candidatus Salinicoccus stercoripullorum]
MKIWKWLFIILLAANIIAVAGLVYLLSGSYTAPGEVDNYSGGNSDMEIQMTNEAVEALIMESIDDDSLSLDISESGIGLNSRNNVYGISVDASFQIEPVATGDTIVFEVSDIDIENIPLPQDALYSIIRSQSDLPEGISFSEDERALIIDTSLFDEAAGFDVRVDSIDYQNNEWYFSMEK